MTPTTIVSRPAMIQLINQFLKIKGNRFVSLVYKRKDGEVSRYTVMMGCNLRKVYQNDIKKLQAYKPENETEKLIRDEMIASLQESLDTEFRNSASVHIGATPEEDTYESIGPNLKYHKETFVTYINSILLSKEVLEAVPEKKVKHGEKVLIKNKIKYGLGLTTTKIRQFKITEEMMKVSVNGKRFEIALN